MMLMTQLVDDDVNEEMSSCCVLVTRCNRTTNNVVALRTTITGRLVLTMRGCTCTSPSSRSPRSSSIRDGCVLNVYLSHNLSMSPPSPIQQSSRSLNHSLFFSLSLFLSIWRRCQEDGTSWRGGRKDPKDKLKGRGGRGGV